MLDIIWLDSERFSVGEISHLSKFSSMPLCKACRGCGSMVNIRKVSSCGHVFVTKRSKPRLTARSSTRKQAMSSFRAIKEMKKLQTVGQLTELEAEEEAFERKSHDKACKGKKRVLETEEEAFECKSHDRACSSNSSLLSCMYHYLDFYAQMCVHFGT